MAVDWAMGVADPGRSFAAGSDYVDKLYNMQAQKRAASKVVSGDYRGAAGDLASRGDVKGATALTNQATAADAGSQYASGDFTGAAGTLAKGGDLQGAETLATRAQTSADAKAAAFQKQQEVLQRGVPFLTQAIQQGGGDPQIASQAFDMLAPHLVGAGTDPAEVAKQKEAFIANPQQWIQVHGAMAQKKYTFQKVGEDIAVFDENNPTNTPIATFHGNKPPPPGYENGPAGPDGAPTLVPVTGGPADPVVKKQDALDRRQVIVSNPAPPAPTLLSPQAIDDGAAYYLQTGLFPGTMRDRASMAAIQNRVADLKPQGVSSADWMRGVRNAAITFNAQKQTAASTGKQQALTVVNENTVNNSVKILNGLLKKGVPSTSAIVSLNDASQWMKREFNDSDAINLKNAVDAISAEYARVMTGQTGGSASSDSARASAASRILLGFSKGAMQSAVQQLQQEMAGRSDSYKNAMEQLTGGYGGVRPMDVGGEPAPIPGQAQGVTAPASNVLHYDQNGNRIP